MVQILTHTREKLVFCQKMKANLGNTAEKLDEKIQKLRLDIKKSKEELKKVR